MDTSPRKRFRQTKHKIHPQKIIIQLKNASMEGTCIYILLQFGCRNSSGKVAHQLYPCMEHHGTSYESRIFQDPFPTGFLVTFSFDSETKSLGTSRTVETYCLGDKS